MKNRFAKHILNTFVASLCLSICSADAVRADSIPAELIPPDVTLSPNVHSTSSSSSTSSASSSAPGLSTPGAVPSPPPVGSRAPAGGLGAAHQAAPPPPPTGSSPMFSGFPTTPPPVPSGHKPPTAYQMQQMQAAAGTNAPVADPSIPDPIAIVETNKGVITIRLFKQYAPKTVEAFVDMSNSGFYNGLIWHRVEPGFVIQGGCPNGNGSGLYIDPKTNQPRMLMLETSPHVKHNMAGVVAMARFPKNPDSASCQFYITLKAQPNLDFKYTIIGGVINGMDVVEHIQKGDKIVSVRIQP